MRKIFIHEYKTGEAFQSLEIAKANEGWISESKAFICHGDKRGGEGDLNHC